jgi:glycine/D-amino acid oxidase-like deaminating enzyme
MAHLGHHALVIGGSIAGLIAARVLSDYFDEVAILERDQIEDRPGNSQIRPPGQSPAWAVTGRSAGTFVTVSGIHRRFARARRNAGYDWARHRMVSAGWKGL